MVIFGKKVKNLNFSNFALIWHIDDLIWKYFCMVIFPGNVLNNHCYPPVTRCKST